jgi:hypothetical protein
MNDENRIEEIYNNIVKSQELEKEMYVKLEKYNTSKEKTIEIIRELNLHVIKRRKLISELRNYCLENCEENCETYTESFTNRWRKRGRRERRERERREREKRERERRERREKREREEAAREKAEREEAEREEAKTRLICSKFENIISDEESLNLQKADLKKKLGIMLPLEINTIKSVNLNTNNYKSYKAQTEIMYKIFYMVLLLNVIIIIEIFLPIIPSIILNILRIIIIGVTFITTYISFQDHYTRDDYDYDKYKFSNDKAVITNASSGVISSDISSENKVNGCVLDLCKNGDCCPDEMFFDRVKGICIVGEENTISNE